MSLRLTASIIWQKLFTCHCFSKKVSNTSLLIVQNLNIAIPEVQIHYGRKKPGK